jgi:DNA-binding protein Fis
MRRNAQAEAGINFPKRVRVLTKSRLLFDAIALLPDLSDILLVMDNNALGMPQDQARDYVVMVDLEHFSVPSWKELNEGTILVVGKGEGLLNAWRRFLEGRPDASLPDALERSFREKIRETLSRWQGAGGAYAFFQGILEEALISEALRITGGNRQKTAKLLGISRTTLRNRLKETGSEDRIIGESRK